ncbi:kinase-like domain-containing protein [Aspergillus candidus]|uniref:Kinase-like domain-containing protein n=1 Tax=Aspergillus candidus TaxID=41067 RepID=A0A2I2FHB7_ASPCN|nr:kinase-like domain-containing protein [Aspergillus candidus]PLB39999.1 kinase-like domain-containing protein [Aspergillus candidus]
MASISALPPRQFPTSGFVRLDSSEKIEEESLPHYDAGRYYPAHIGDVLVSRYQIVSKLGYGTSSTAWLCRDLLEQVFYTIKICIRGQNLDHEIDVSKHLQNADDHFGKKLVRLVLDSFEVVGPHGKHVCLVYQPLGMNFAEFQKLLPDSKFPKNLAQRSIQLILISLAFMHENNVTHTDVSSNNILQGVEDRSVLSRLEEDEVERPVARKVLGDRTIYYSRPMPSCAGLPILSDLGEARIGNGKHKGDIMPGIYRAPQVILDMDWGSSVDIWSIGTMIWDLVEGSHLFFAKRNRTLNDEQHLAEMVSLMGPPPPEFLKRSEKCHHFWDEKGNWKGSIPIPEQSLEMREIQLSGEDKELFVSFLRRILRWLPEERPTAEELAYDEFLMQAVWNSS